MQEELSEIMNNLTENARFALQKADLFSKSYNKGYMSTEHLLMGILDQDTSTGAKLLIARGITLEDVEKQFSDKTDVDLSNSHMAMMSLSEACILTLRMAGNYVKENGLKDIGTEHLLYALVNQTNSRAAQILIKCGLDLDGLISDIDLLIESQIAEEENEKEREKYLKSGKTNLRFLKKFGTDLTALAKRGELDTVIGRDSEIERTVTVLSRRTKSNPVLIGEAGVGKTAIVEGLATRIANDNVPSGLIGKRIFEIDLSSMVAGTKFRGEFEERIKGVIDEASSDKNIILFIDELHLLMGAGSSEGNMDAANILKPALARGTIKLIGATTLDEYRKSIEKDKALSRRFQTVMVEEPSKTVALRILKGIKGHYEKHHGVSISDELLSTVINMSVRYISDRALPDKAIDVIDEASAIAKVAWDKKDGGKLKKMKIESNSLGEKIEEFAEKGDYKRAAELKTEQSKLEKEIEKLEKTGAKEDDVPEVTEDDVRKAISLKTGIPVAKVHGDEMSMLINLETHLKKSIIGQDEAIKAISSAIRRGRSGITDARRPIGSFMFMGPTGVGKTELARVIAREVFGGENSLIKIDMSEFGEKHNVSRLVGAPAGYVGYDDGGKLTEAVRRHPYSVVLFDEIEKAHKDVFNLLLQILEDGVLTDGQGNKIKFNNTIVILTSNLGSSDMFADDGFGFSEKHDSHRKKTKEELEQEYEDQKSAARRALERSMRPELINRLDKIITFHALTRSDVERIFDNLIDDLKKRLSAQNIGLVITDEVKDYLIDLGYDEKNGARPLRRAIEDYLESLISDAIITGDVKKGQIAKISLVGSKKSKKTLDKTTHAKLKLEVENE